MSNYGNTMGIAKIPCSEEETISPSPMTNPVVLAHLFQVCDLRDLRRYRLVSKQWHDISLTRWREGMILNLQRMRDLSCRRDLFELHEETETELMKFKPKPFRRYRPGYLRADRLWEVCGSSMTVLELDATVFSCVHLKKIIFEDTPHLVSLTLLNLHEHVPTNRQEINNFEEQQEMRVQPNLKILKVSASGDMRSRLKIGWSQLFHRFPNVAELEINDYYFSLPEHPHHLDHLVTTLEKGRRKINWRAIKKLNILDVGGCPPLLKRIFALPQMKLESIYFENWSLPESSGVLALAFQLHGNTLKELYLEEKEHSPGHQSLESFRCLSHALPSLSELKLKGGVCHNLHFLSQTPNLRVLHINQLIIPPLNLADAKNLVLPWVEELHIQWVTEYGGGAPDSSRPNTNFCLSEQILEILTNLMPNVKHFKSNLTAKALQVVCTKWRELRSLHVAVDGLSDSAITGIVPGQEELVPNLTDLKYLQVLRMDNSDNLTAASVFQGFFQMSRLHTLKVILPDEMSEDAVKALVNRFTVFRWRKQDFASLDLPTREEWLNNN